MFDFLDDIHSQALSDSRDLILKIDVCINWGVSAVLLPELHCSHFMGSIIPLMTRLSLIKRMIEVRNVNWGGYYPGGRRSISVRSERVQSESDSNAGINSLTAISCYGGEKKIGLILSGRYVPCGGNHKRVRMSS